MAASLVQHASNSAVAAATTQTLAFPQNNTAGNTLIAFGITNGSTSLVFSDSQGNTWQQAIIEVQSSTLVLVVAYALNCKAGPNTVTATSTANNTSCREIMEVSGITGFDSAAATGGFTNNGLQSFQTGTYTPNFGGEFILSCSWTFGTPAGVTSISAPFTILDPQGAGSSYCGSGYLIATDSSAQSPTLTTSGPATSGWLWATVGFKTATTPTPGVVGLGTWQGSSFASVFSKSANPSSLDLMQVINEGGKVVWSLNSAGVTATNPANPTSEVLLAQYFAPSLAFAFTNPLNYDLMQILGAGGAVVFHINSLGVASTP